MEEKMTGTTEGGKKTAEGGHGDPNKASPTAVEKYLKGINFPASKEDLLEHARDNNAPDDVLNVINQFTDKEYNGPIDISKEMKKGE